MSTTSAVPVKVMTSDEFREWRRRTPTEELPARIAQQGYAPLVVLEFGFHWACPGCGHVIGGSFGAEPISGWAGPRWTREGDDEHLTLTPSLGCPGWRDGKCSGGHYWLRDGQLVPA